MIKPRVYWTFYKGVGRGFWRVSPMPSLKGNGVINKRGLRDLWQAAHAAVHKANHELELAHIAANPKRYPSAAVPPWAQPSDGVPNPERNF